MLSRIRISKYQRGLWFRHGEFLKLVRPGVYLVPGRVIGRDRIEVFDTLKTHFQHDLLDVLVEDEAVRSELLVVDLEDEQRAFVWENGRLAYFLGPGRHAFWKQPRELEVEVFSTNVPRLEHPKLDAILAHPEAGTYLTAVNAGEHERVLFFQAGELIDSIDSGLAAFWKRAVDLTWRAVDLREQVADVAGQEIMTADKVTLRVNLLVTYRVVDPLVAVTTVEDAAQALYRQAQLALRATVGARTLDVLLSDKEAIGVEVREAIDGRVRSFGVNVKDVGLRDVVLPGEMKTILNQVIEAQKRAEANLIRRREETAAARSQANTARLLADNPVLARMKELEAVQEILAGSKATFLFGRGDLAGELRGLATDGHEDDGES